ncbi:MAG: cadmium-translocating P-type ATPase [Saprospirales bacterium]|nr:MAG: cadmium-translocating P-type ATPase [Saprospirales bacterium]
MNPIEWKVEGMTCGGCVQKLRQQLEKEGAQEIFIDLASGGVEFTSISSDYSSLEKIKKSIHLLGFKVAKEDSKAKGDFLKIKLIIASIFTFPLLFGHLLMMTPIPMPVILENGFFQLVICLPVYLIGLQHFGTSAWGAIRSGTSNMDVLIFMGTTAAFFYSLTGTIIDEPDYFFYETAATIITLVLAGNFIEKRAIKSTTSSIDDLIKLQKTFAHRKEEDGRTTRIPSSEVQVGDHLFVNEGDQVPCDGIILSGEGSFDEALLTGEGIPVFRKKGDELVGASVLISGNVVLKATAVGKESFLGRLIKLVKNAQNSKSGMQILADKISSVFVPVVILIALATFFISWSIVGIALQSALMNAVAVLVIACPCAMGIATPTAVMVGVGRAAKMGILPRLGDSFERLAGIEHLVLDKTGTLTSGRFLVDSFECQSENTEEISGIIYQMEQRSNHPVAKAITDFFKPYASIHEKDDWEKITEIPGSGIEAYTKSGDYFLLSGEDTDLKGVHLITLKKNGEEIAFIQLKDSLKDNAKQAMNYFRNIGIKTILLSGDRKAPTETVAKTLAIDTFYAMQSPEEKLKVIEDYTAKGRTAMVGDGINDAVALARADIGIAYSSTATLAMQSADIVLLNDQLETLVDTHKLSRKTVTTIKQNLFWAFSYNIVAIPMAALGFLNPMAAAFFMAFSDLVVIGNSVRLKWKKL